MRPFKNRFTNKLSVFFIRHPFRIVGKEEDSNYYFSAFSGKPAPPDLFLKCSTLLMQLHSASINQGFTILFTIFHMLVRICTDSHYAIFFYPGEKHSDMFKHFEVVKEYLWAFNYMLNTGSDPAFVIAELLKRNDQKSKEKK